MRAPILVKKYANRRLYDTEASSYVGLEELADKIRRGTDVQVVDAQSGQDLTQSTLTQIILESRGAAKLLPVPLLLQLIRMGDDALAEFFGRYLSASLELYLSAKQGAQTLAPYAPFATLPFQATNALARLLSGVAPWQGAAAPHGGPEPLAADVVPPAPPTGNSTSDEVAALRREMAELRDFLRDRSRKRVSKIVRRSK
ncbi:MAG: polyhydroxyalkanoate synthesis repressor PhaR [Deltaproteobacteria bacterium]|nr:polyhydroxyalkanoate synthesis repressor PhaR [Deltaproteobacteria bacterium]